jgi:hypothetical protein
MKIEQSAPKRRLLNFTRRRLSTHSPMNMEQRATKRRLLNSTRQRLLTHSPMKMEKTECSETSVIKIHTPVNNPKRKHSTVKTR